MAKIQAMNAPGVVALLRADVNAPRFVMLERLVGRVGTAGR